MANVVPPYRRRGKSLRLCTAIPLTGSQRGILTDPQRQILSRHAKGNCGWGPVGLYVMPPIDRQRLGEGGCWRSQNLPPAPHGQFITSYLAVIGMWAGAPVLRVAWCVKYVLLIRNTYSDNSHAAVCVCSFIHLLSISFAEEIHILLCCSFAEQNSKITNILLFC